MISRIESLYDAGEVKRLHTVPTLRPNTIAEHVYGSMVIATELIKLNRVSAARQSLSLSYEHVMSTLLVHDAPESVTGDVPAPLKRQLVALLQIDIYDELEQQYYRERKIEVPDLNPVEADIVKAADTMDLGYRCLMEFMLGNRHPRMHAVIENVIRYMLEKKHLDGVLDMVDHLQESYKGVNNVGER